VNVVNVEDYLLGVVSSEMKPSYPLEALKAQAVAARTYAVKNIGHFADQGFDMYDTPYSQVYGGYFSEDPRTTEAVRETRGEVITYHGELIDALYSSTCGGITEDAQDALGKSVPYLKSVADYTDAKSAVTAPKTEEQWAAFFKSAPPLICLQPKYARVDAFRWVKMLTRREIEDNLPPQDRVGTLMNIVPVNRGKSGRINELRLEGTKRSVTIASELEIRNALGGSADMRSSAFTVDTYRDDKGKPVVFALWGAGWGHGLGLCQVGAVGYAENGWSYDKILHHYYTDVTITQKS
jgi:SpoIID/LytB domain protein